MAQQHGGSPQDDQAGPIDITPVPDDPGSAGDRPVWLTGDQPAAPESRRRPRRTRRLVLGALLAAGLAGVAVVGTVGARIISQKDAALRPPDAFADLTRDNSAGAATTADDLRTALAAGIDLDETVAVVYADPGGPNRSVFFFGGTALLLSPGRELDGVLELLDERGGGGAAMREVEPGDLGGVMKCGTVKVPEGTMAACGWADHGSLAVAMFPERPVAEAADLMRQLRQETQTRS